MAVTDRSGFCKTLALVMLSAVFALPSARADVINVDVSGVDPEFRDLFIGAEAFWESRIQNFSSALPLGLRRRLRPLQITASTGQIDGVGGAVGGAAVTRTESFTTRGFLDQRTYVVSQAADMIFDLADLSGFDPNDPLSLSREDFADTIIHEMGHAMGFGSLWADNGYLGAAGASTQYTWDGFALERYRSEAQNPFSQFVPIEQAGGGGTALSHWSSEDDFFNQLDTTGMTETMLGFIFNLDSQGNLRNGIDFVSETTWGAMADLHWEVQGINDGFRDKAIGGGGGIFPEKWTGSSRPPLFFRGLSAVPEPGSGIALLGFTFALIARRRKA